jgi:hypothetical protein
VFLCGSRRSSYSRYYDSNALERARLGPSTRGGESTTECLGTLGILWVAQVLRLPTDMVIGFPTSVSDCDVEH